jgi:hypothetical protein
LTSKFYRYLLIALLQIHQRLYSRKAHLNPTQIVNDERRAIYPGLDNA